MANYNKEIMKVFSTINCHLDSKIHQVENETLFLEKILYQELPQKKLSKYQKTYSMKNVDQTSNEEVKFSKIDDSIKETLEKAKNLLDNIKNEDSKKVLFPEKNIKVLPELNIKLLPEKNNKIDKNLKKGNEKHLNIAKSRKFSVENSRNKAKTKQSLEEVVKIPLSLKKINEHIVKTVASLENTQKTEEIIKPKVEYFLFRPENLQQKFSIQKESFQIYFEIRKKLNSNKKDYLESLNYYKEKSIKAQSKFLNKLENHYSEKKKVLREKSLKKDPNTNLTFSSEVQICEKLDIPYYSLCNYVKLLRFYIEEAHSKEIKNIDSFNEKPDAKKNLSEVLFLWCFTNYFEENMSLINLKIEDFFQNNYIKTLPKIRNFLFSTFTIENSKEKLEKMKNHENDYICHYQINNFDSKENPGFKVWFEKKLVLKESKKYEEKLWMINETIFKVITKKILKELYFSQLSEFSLLIKSSKDPKKNEILKEKLKILRMIFILCLNNKGFPIFYLRETC